MSVPPAEPDGPEPRPGPLQPRIGDAERDRAVGFLQEHMAQGRLDAAEFDDRLTRALQARTAADLEPLFDDLPEPRPGGLAPTHPYSAPPWSATGSSAVGPVPQEPPLPVPSGRGPRTVPMIQRAIWPVAIVLFIASGWDFWWVFVVAGVLTYFLRGASASGRPEQPGPDDPPRQLHR